MGKTTNTYGFELCRDDGGSGGWSLHSTGVADQGKDDYLLLSGPAELVEGKWSRPAQADYDLARFLQIRGYCVEVVECVVSDHGAWGWEDAAPATAGTVDRIRSAGDVDALLRVMDAETGFDDSWGYDCGILELLGELRELVAERKEALK